jgi:hypothetical protein
VFDIPGGTAAFPQYPFEYTNDPFREYPYPTSQGIVTQVGVGGIVTQAAVFWPGNYSASPSSSVTIPDGDGGRTGLEVTLTFDVGTCDYANVDHLWGGYNSTATSATVTVTDNYSTTGEMIFVFACTGPDLGATTCTVTLSKALPAVPVIGELFSLYQDLPAYADIPDNGQVMWTRGPDGIPQPLLISGSPPEYCQIMLRPVMSPENAAVWGALTSPSYTWLPKTGFGGYMAAQVGEVFTPTFTPEGRNIVPGNSDSIIPGPSTFVLVGAQWHLYWVTPIAWSVETDTLDINGNTLSTATVVQRPSKELLFELEPDGYKVRVPVVTP